MQEPSAAGLVTMWTWQPVAVVAAGALAWWYVRAAGAVRGRGSRWPRHRDAVFAFGLVLWLWTASGFLQTYADSLYWAFVTQVLVLWLLVPAVLLAAQPLHLGVIAHGRDGVLGRVLRSRPVRLFGSPLVGPALVPVLAFALFFGPLPRIAAGIAPVGWVLHLVLLAVGALMLLPLLGIDTFASPLTVALALAVGSFELFLGAIPGMLLRLNSTLLTSYFDIRAQHDWSPTPLHDQSLGGAVLWGVAGLIDLPFLLLLFRRWVQADARDAAAADAVLEAEHLARASLREAGSPDTDAPWWVSDREMQERFRHERH